MVEKIEAYLVLGCNGYSANGFNNCFGVSNPIIDLSEIEDRLYLRLMDFFDSACDLFGGPVYDYNKTSNILNMMCRDFNAFPEEMLYNIQYFIKTHRRCGLYLVILMKEDF